MSDNDTSSNDKIAEALSIITQRGDAQKDALIELATQTRETKTLLSDVIAQRTEYAADINDLKASINTTRRALDPEALGAHVADNIEELMGQSVQAFAKGIQLNHDAATANMNAARNTISTNQDLDNKITALKKESRTLANIAANLEERDQRSKWDWATLGAAMLLAAGAVYFTKQQLDNANFQDAIRFIQNDDDGYWCSQQAQASVVQDRDGNWFCAVGMPEYQPPVDGEDNE